MKAIILSLVLLMTPLLSFAGGYTGTITSVVCHEQSVSSNCQIQPSGIATVPDCAKSSGWKFAFDSSTVEGRNILSILLAAQVSKQTVAIGGKGYCKLTPASEDVRHVYIISQ